MTNPSDLERAHEVWRVVDEKVKLAVLEIAVRRDSGKIEIHFGSGEFKAANKTVTL